MRQLVLWLYLLAAGPAFALPQAGQVDVLALLERARVAAERLDYSGSFVRQRGSEVSSTRIVHQRVGQTVREKLESLDGPPAETVRQGVELVTYLPEQRRKVIESRVQGPGFPAVIVPARESFERTYLSRSFAGDRVAGRSAVAIALDARDRFHFSYRFWFDKATGLLLRAQRVDEAGEVVEQVAFVELRLGRPPAADFKPGVSDTRGWQVDNLTANPADLSGWRLRWLPGGFRRIASVTRTLKAAKDGEARDVAQLLYSDGLASLSVFIEPYSAERSESPLQLGALNMVGKRYGKFWLTIVGEVPMAAIRQVAESVEFAQTFPR